MLDQEIFRIDDPERVRALVRAHPWATLVSATERNGLVVSHLPVLVAEDGGAEEDGGTEGDGAEADRPEDGRPLTLLGHLARTDAEQHELGSRKAVLVFQGPHGYLSPTWYEETPHVPTWNFVVVHVHGRPQILDPDRTYQVLSDTVDHFERRMPEPWQLDEVSGYAHRIAAAVTGFALPAARVTAKAKLSQDESQDLSRRVVAALESDRPYRDPALAEAMRTTWRQR